MPILVVAVIFAACDGTFRSRPFESTVCGGQVAGYTATIVAYADSSLIVIPLSKIHLNTEWRFVLVPKILGKSLSGEDYKDKIVTIKGKRPEDAWINTAGPSGGAITGTFETADDNMLTACVNIAPEPALGTAYYYVVEVEDVGTLDPRADINN